MRRRFYVYIMANYNRTVLYTGFTNDIVRRVIEHQNGLGCEFSVKYKTICLMHYETYGYVSDAINREKEIKKWGRRKKLSLIDAENPNLEDLSVVLFKDYGLTERDKQEILHELKEKYTYNNCLLEPRRAG